MVLVMVLVIGHLEQRAIILLDQEPLRPSHHTGTELGPARMDLGLRDLRDAGGGEVGHKDRHSGVLADAHETACFVLQKHLVLAPELVPLHRDDTFRGSL